MTYPYSPQKIEDLGCGDHLCCFYKTEGEYQHILTYMVQQGLALHEKVICLIEDTNARSLLEHLQAEGLDTQAAMARGDLIFLAAASLHPPQDHLDPDRIVTLLRTEKERALTQGYTALRCIQEASVVQPEFKNLDQWLHIEEMLNDLSPDNDCMLVCFYDQNRFDRETQIKILHLHPLAIIGTDLYDNFYHMPVAELVGHELRKKTPPHRIDTGRLDSSRLPASLQESDMRLYIP